LQEFEVTEEHLRRISVWQSTLIATIFSAAQ